MLDPGAPGTALLGRYVLHDEIASGGMATVHLGRLLGAAGFSRTVAIKRLHPQLSKESEFVTMFLDEARLASRIQHPNAVATLDVIAEQDELFLVMEYIAGESLSKLLRTASQKGYEIDPAIINSIVAGALHGLHAAHEARDARGEPLHIVHRDISPQNILVGEDGVARVLDFGVAKAAMRLQTTREGTMKGKIAYMAPEQLRAEPLDRRADLFAAAVVHWEALSRRRLFVGDDVGELLGKVLNAKIPRCSEYAPIVTDELDDVVMRGLSRDREQRYATARDYAMAIENVGPMALPRVVGEWVKQVGGEALTRRSQKVALVEKMAPDDDYASHERLADARARLQKNPLAFAARSVLTPVAVPARSADDSPTVADTLDSRALRKTRTRRRTALAAGGGVALVAALVWATSSRPSEPSAGSGAAQVTPVPLASSQPSAASPVTPAPLASADPPPAVVAAKVAAPVSKSRPVVKATAKTSCDPPYVIDSRGIRRVKPGCR